MIRVQAWNEFASPKFYGSLALWPWLRTSPLSSLNVIYCLIITTRQWLMSFIYLPCIPMQINPIKAHWGTGSWPFSFERLATFPPQADHVLVDLFLSVADSRGLGICGRSSAKISVLNSASDRLAISSSLSCIFFWSFDLFCHLGHIFFCLGIPVT